MELKFFKCAHCGNIAVKVLDKGVPMFCCGQKMDELVPGTTDASVEKHVPVVTQDGSKVNVFVGGAEHPMIPEHYTQFIVLETKAGWQIKYLQPGSKPSADFVLAEGDELVAAYEYCNLHSLWKK